MLALALPGAGCSTFSYLDFSAAGSGRSVAKQAVALPNLGAESESEVAVFLAQAQQARATGELDTAARILTQLVLIAPDNPRVIAEYGKALAAQGRSDDALAFLDRAIQLAPGDWTLYSAQGVAFDQQRKYLSAQASYARALELKPGEPAILNNDALSHMQAGDLAGAESLLRQVSAQSPDYPRITKNLALLEKLKAATPAPTAAAPSQRMTAIRDGMPAPVVMQWPLPVPMSKADLASAVQMPEPLVVAQPLPEPVPANAVAAQPVSANAGPMSAYEALKADPTVMMAPIPVEESPAPSPRLLPKPPVVSAPSPDVHGTAESRQTSVSGRIYVQAGAYLTDAHARQAATGLEAMDVKIMQANVNGRDIFRVRIGPFDTMAAAKTAYAEAQGLGRSDLFITRE